MWGQFSLIGQSPMNSTVGTGFKSLWFYTTLELWLLTMCSKVWISFHNHFFPNVDFSFVFSLVQFVSRVDWPTYWLVPFSYFRIVHNSNVTAYKFSKIVYTFHFNT